jgi:lipoate---protein ligase
VPGGKLVRVTVARDGRVEISGDFFLYPEEGITLIEDALSRLDGMRPAGDIERLLHSLIAGTNIELIGIDVPVIVRLYQRCLTCGE